MTCSMPVLPVHHQLPEPTQTHVHWVSDAIQPSHPLSLGKGIRMMKQGLRVIERWLFYITKPFSISRIPSKGYYKLEFLTYIQTHKMQENKHNYNKLKITLKMRYGIFSHPKIGVRDLPGGPVVEPLSSNAGGADSLPSQGTKIPHASWPNHQKHKTETNL